MEKTIDLFLNKIMEEITSDMGKTEIFKIHEIANQFGISINYISNHTNILGCGILLNGCEAYVRINNSYPKTIQSKIALFEMFILIILLDNRKKYASLLIHSSKRKRSKIDYLGQISIIHRKGKKWIEESAMEMVNHILNHYKYITFENVLYNV